MEETKNCLMVYDSASIQRRIYTIREVQVMLDKDLAIFYGVETKVLNQVVKRNIERFPQEFMFQLDEKEWESLRFQIGATNINSLRSQIVTLENNYTEMKDG